MRRPPETTVREVLSLHRATFGTMKCDLSYQDISGLDLRKSYLTTAKLEGANLSNCDLTGCEARYVDLAKANLTEANCQSVDLLHANLSSSNLSWTNFKNADLTNADLTGANLDGAVLDKALLKDTKFSDASQLAKADLCNIRNEFLFGLIGQDLDGVKGRIIDSSGSSFRELFTKYEEGEFSPPVHGVVDYWTASFSTEVGPIKLVCLSWVDIFVSKLKGI